MHAYITLIIPRERLQTQQGGQVRIEQALALSSLNMQSNAGSLSVINSGISCLHPFYNRQNIVITVEGCKFFQPVGRGCSSNRLQPSNRASPGDDKVYGSEATWILFTLKCRTFYRSVIVIFINRKFTIICRIYT